MKNILPFVFLICFSKISFCQFNYNATNTVYISGTYTDLDVTGTAITNNFNGNAMTYDQDNSSIQNIGFNFKYNGVNFSQFILNSNGFIKLGTLPPSYYSLNVFDSADTHIIAPYIYYYGLNGNQNSEFRVMTTGLSGSKICTIQFKNLRSSVYDTINFQIKLYEGSNKIEFIYGRFIPGTADYSTTILIGLKGINSTKSVIANKEHTQSWSATQFINGTQTNNWFNLIRDSLPPIGTTFQFTSDYSQFTYTALNTFYNGGIYTNLANTATNITINYDGNTMTYDDDNSAIQNIGFNFSFNGSVFTQFVLNSNGFIKLGISRPIQANYNVLNSSDINTIAPFNYNLDGGANPSYRLLTSGSPGSRVCTIQFRNLREWNANRQYNKMSFQIKLYEGSNKVEFVYNSFTASNASPTPVPAIIGIKGNSSINSVNVIKSVLQTWGNIQFINGGYSFGTFENQNDVMPVSGTIFQFNVALYNDAKLVNVFALGKIPLPLGSYKNVINAKVINLGLATLNNIPVTMNITGANTFTNTKLVTLDPQDSILISFDPFSSWNIGNNTITISVPNDDDNLNNVKNYLQDVNTDVISYADQSPPSGSKGFGIGGGTLYTKYTTTGGNAKVTSIKVHISNNLANVGNTVRAIIKSDVVSDQYSDPYVISNSDLGTYKKFLINNPVDIVYSGSNSFYKESVFYAGLEQTPNVLLAYYPVSYQHDGDPGRGGAFYEGSMNGQSISENASLGRLMIEANVIVATSPAPHSPPSYTFFSEKILAQWDLNGINSPISAVATIYDPDLTSSNLLTRGPDAPQSPENNSFLTTGFQNNGISVINNDYFQIQLSPKANDTLSLSSIHYHPMGDTAFAATPGVLSQFAYSLDGTNFNLIGTPHLINYYDAFSYFNYYFELDDIPQLQNIIAGNTVTFRYYASGQTTSGSWGFGPDLYEPGLSIHGKMRSNIITPQPIVPTGADFILPTCNSTANGSISFTSTGIFSPGNIYTAQLGYLTFSGPFGDIANWNNEANNIGTLVSSANSGTINFTIPNNVIDASTHVIRIISSAPSNSASTLSQQFGIYHSVACVLAWGSFRSKQTGKWNEISTWEYLLNGNWVPSTITPDERSDILISAPDTVSITTPINVRFIIVKGKIKLLNGGSYNGAITFFNYQPNYRYNDYSMRIDSGGILQVLSSGAVFNDLIKKSISYTNIPLLIDVRPDGLITIGDGTAINGDGFYAFATTDSRYLFRDAAIFEWNSTSSFGPISNAAYFSPLIIRPRSVITVHPILRLTNMPPGTFGGLVNTVINGTLEINTPVTMLGAGTKTFRDGIKGSSRLTQASGSGEFKTINPYTIFPPTDTSGTTIGIADGNLIIDLNNAGLTIENGITVTDSANVKIIGFGISFGKIEVQPGGKLNIDQGSALTIENADLVNDGIINGPGKIKFTGGNLSAIQSTGLINVDVELYNKQLYLNNNTNTSSIHLFDSSNLRLDSFKLDMRNGTLIGDSVNFIITNDTGRLIRTVANNPTTFHIGIDNTSYTPVTITNTGTPDKFLVRVEPGVSTTIPIITENVNRTWIIRDSIQGGSNLTLKMQWNAIDEQAGFNRMSSYISHYNVCPPPIGCTVDYYDLSSPAIASGTGPYIIERSGINNFNSNSFIVTSMPFIYTFTGNGDWNDPINWAQGLIPPPIIGESMEVIINPSGSGECIHNGDIIIQQLGKLTVLPGKVFRVRH